MPDALEKGSSSDSNEHREASSAHRSAPLRFLHRITALLANYGIETHGIAPIPAAQRTDKRWYQMFFVWFSANMNILSFATGTAGPAFYSLGVRDAIVVLVVTDVVSCLFPAIFSVYGPKLGMRAMVQSRYSWGYYGAMVPSILNVITMEGFLILNCIIGGQTLASLSSHLDDTLGIVIISVISLLVTFLGYQFIHWYESIAWLPSVVAFIAMLALGYPHLQANLHVAVPPPSASSIISFGSTTAATVISWSTMTADYGIYHSPAASSTKIFVYTYLGFLVPSITGHVIGAAFAAAAPHVPVWNAAFRNSTSAGGLLYGVLTPLGGFGKFLTVLVTLGVPCACAPTMYTFSTSLMSVAHWFSLVPRWVYILVSEGVLIPLAVIGARRFYSTFVDVLDIIGYWNAAFVGIVLAEHVLFRGASFSETGYPPAAWDVPRLLPLGVAAVVSFVCAVGALVPFMSQAWYVGPVARDGSGDCGIYVAFVVSVLCYAVLRTAERRWERRRREREGTVTLVQEDGLKA